jgi:hypothetical protein
VPGEARLEPDGDGNEPEEAALSEVTDSGPPELWDSRHDERCADRPTRRPDGCVHELDPRSDLDLRAVEHSAPPVLGRNSARWRPVGLTDAIGHSANTMRR